VMLPTIQYTACSIADQCVKSTTKAISHISYMIYSIVRLNLLSLLNIREIWWAVIRNGWTTESGGTGCGTAADESDGALANLSIGLFNTCGAGAGLMEILWWHLGLKSFNSWGS